MKLGNRIENYSGRNRKTKLEDVNWTKLSRKYNNKKTQFITREIKRKLWFKPMGKKFEKLIGIRLISERKNGIN